MAGRTRHGNRAIHQGVGIALLTLGIIMAIPVGFPRLWIWLYFKFIPPRRYHYYYLAGRDSPDILLLCLTTALIVAGLWLVARSSESSRP